jgi:hypothetical protein
MGEGIMDALERKRLEERIVEEVHRMLTEGNLSYLLGLNRAGLIEALEHELRFLGFYHRDDRETPALIHALLEEKLDQWCEDYLRPREVSMAGEKQPNSETKVQIEASPLIQNISSAAIGIMRTEKTQYIGFSFFQVNPIPA